MTLRCVCMMALLAGLATFAAPDVRANRIISNPVDSEFYSPNQLRYVATGGEILTVVHGNAFRMAKAEFDAVVTGLMDGRPQWVAPIRYTTHPGDAAKTAYWVVLVFNPPRGYDGLRACRNDAGARGPSASGSVEVVAAFCSKTHVHGETRARLTAADGPHDPTFGALLRQVQVDLFPPHPPNLGRDMFPQP